MGRWVVWVGNFCETIFEALYFVIADTLYKCLTQATHLPKLIIQSPEKMIASTVRIPTTSQTKFLVLLPFFPSSAEK